jgi:hypothetical protein
VRLRFQADEDFNQTIVLAITRREPGIDFQTVTQAGFKGRQDPEVLALAAEAGRVLARGSSSARITWFRPCVASFAPSEDS